MLSRCGQRGSLCRRFPDRSWPPTVPFAQPTRGGWSIELSPRRGAGCRFAYRPVWQECGEGVAGGYVAGDHNGAHVQAVTAVARWAANPWALHGARALE